MSTGPVHIPTKIDELKIDDVDSSQYADNNNNDEIKFYEPGDAPEYVSTENPANIDSIVQDEKPSLGKETIKSSDFSKLELALHLCVLYPAPAMTYNISLHFKLLYIYLLSFPELNF